MMCRKCDNHYCENCEDMSAFIDFYVKQIQDETGATYSEVLDALQEWVISKVNEWNDKRRK